MSGVSGISDHATTVGTFYYGSITSIAPAVNTTLVYEAGYWVSTFLGRGSDFSLAQSPLAPENHSWIGTLGMEFEDADVLRRTDLLADRDGVVIVAGVNNGAGSAMPKLLGSAYNVVTVGLTSGGSSYGPTLVDGSGRVKPDLVAPAGSTSWATPMVSSSAAIVVQEADSQGVLGYLDPEEQRPAKALLVKALLMGGATKTEFANWRKGFATPSTDGTVPLDYRYGAGELNIDNSHRILTAGEQNAGASSDVALAGWDYGQASPAAGQLYFYEVPSQQYVQTLSIMVTWNRHITMVPGGILTPTPSLANIDLRLYEANGFTRGCTA